MKKYSRQQLQNIYMSLPQDLKEALFSVENAEKIRQISKRHQIPSKKISILADMAGRVVLGILALENFANALELTLNINKQTTEKIAQDIKQEIFQPIMANLTKVQQESSQKPISKSVPKPIPPRSPTTPKPKDENIVDLKNLPRE